MRHLLEQYNQSINQSMNRPTFLNSFRSYPIDDDNELPAFEPQPDDDVPNGQTPESLARDSAPEADEVF